jgi:hypothetical protein
LRIPNLARALSLFNVLCDLLDDRAHSSASQFVGDTRPCEPEAVADRQGIVAFLLEHAHCHVIFGKDEGAVEVHHRAIGSLTEVVGRLRVQSFHRIRRKQALERDDFNCLANSPTSRTGVCIRVNLTAVGHFTCSDLARAVLRSNQMARWTLSALGRSLLCAIGTG